MEGQKKQSRFAWMIMAAMTFGINLLFSGVPGGLTEMLGDAIGTSLGQLVMCSIAVGAAWLISLAGSKNRFSGLTWLTVLTGCMLTLAIFRVFVGTFVHEQMQSENALKQAVPEETSTALTMQSTQNPANVSLSDNVAIEANRAAQDANAAAFAAEGAVQQIPVSSQIPARTALQQSAAWPPPVAPVREGRRTDRTVHRHEEPTPIYEEPRESVIVHNKAENETLGQMPSWNEMKKMGESQQK